MPQTQHSGVDTEHSRKENWREGPSSCLNVQDATVHEEATSLLHEIGSLAGKVAESVRASSAGRWAWTLQRRCTP